MFFSDPQFKQEITEKINEIKPANSHISEADTRFKFNPFESENCKKSDCFNSFFLLSKSVINKNIKDIVIMFKMQLIQNVL